MSTRRYLSRETDHLGQIQAALRGLIGHSTLAFELIQNADDAGAGEITFDIRADELVVENDETFTDCEAQEASLCPWTENSSTEGACDFHSFRRVAGGAKREREDTTGAFGIGFIAVYQITDRPEVVSSRRHWLIDEMAEPDRRIEECGGCERCKGIDGTRFYLPWASDPESPLRRRLRADVVSEETRSGLLDALSGSLDWALLFLRHVNRIVLLRSGRPVKELERQIEGSDVVVSDGKKVQLWRLAEADFSEQAEGLRERHGDFRIETKRQARTTLAIPVDHEVRGLLCAYLPTEQQTGLPFHINADFFTSPDRKRILFEADYQSQWNRAALEAAGEALRSAVPDLPELLGPVQLWSQAVAVWKATREDEERPTSLHLGGIWTKLRLGLLDHEVMFTAERDWCRPGEAHLLDLEPGEVERALGVLRLLGFRHPHPDLHPLVKEMEWKKSLDIEAVTLDSLIEALQSGGLTVRLASEQLPPPLNTEDGREALWWMTRRLLDKRRTVIGAETRRALAACSLALGGDGALWPCDSIYLADDETVRVFEPFDPEVGFVATELSEEGRDLMSELCPEFDASAAMSVLEEATSSLPLEFDAENILKWFQARSEEVLSDGELARRLGELPIFPGAKELRPLTRLFLPGGFEDPLGLSEVLNVRRGSGLAAFIEDLGARTLTFERYVREFIPRALREQSVPVERMRDVSAFLALHIGQLKDDAEAHVALRELPLVECADGEFRSADECYFETNIVLRVLGDEVPFAHVPKGSSASSQDLFMWLGVAARPRPEGVVEAVSVISSESPSERSIARIAQVIEFLGDELRDADRLSSSYVPLARMGWLPAEADQESWWAPSNLYTKFRDYLFSSQARFLAIPRSAQTKAADALELLGVETEPSCDLVVAHLLHSAETEQPVSTEVYRFLDDNHEDASVQKLKGEPCLFVDGEYLRGDQVFWEDHPFGRYRRTLNKDLRRFGNFFELLGVRPHPDYADALAVLQEIADTYGRANEPIEAEEDRSVVHGCWMMLERALEDGQASEESLAVLGGRRIVPDGAWLLREPADLLFEDLPAVAEKFPKLVAQHLIEPTGGMLRAMRAAGVAQLSERLEIEITELFQARDDEALRRRLEERTSELRRVIETELGSGAWGHALVKLRDLRTVLAQELSVQYSLAFRGDHYQGVVEMVPAHYDPAENRLYFVQKDHQYPWPTLARQLARALTWSAEHLSHVAAPFHSILRAASRQDASQLLDELGYARLKEPELADVAGAVADEVGSGGTHEGAPPSYARQPADIEEVPGEEVPSFQPEEAATLTTGGEGVGDGERHRGSRSVLRTYVQGDGEVDDSERDPLAERMRDEVEQAGVDVAVQFEVNAGRMPEVMPPKHPGFDVESRNDTGQVERYIEVKSLRGAWELSAAGLTREQFKKAGELERLFWLYVVEDALSDEPRLYRIQNPAVRATQFLFDDGWRALAEPADIEHPEDPVL